MRLRSSHSLSRRLAAGMAFLAAFGATALAQQDRIYKKGSTEPILDVVAAETCDGVKLQAGIELRPESIASIEYFDAPVAFREGETMRKQGRFEDAVKYYTSALSSPRARKFWLEPNCNYYIALCSLELGDFPKAAEAFKELIQKYPDNRFLADAMLGLGRVEYAAKQYDAALKRFDELAAKALSKKWDEWGLHAGLWKARTLLAMERYDEALAQAKRVTEASSRFGEIQIQAQAIEAIVAVRQQEYAKAITLLRSLIKRIRPDIAKEIETRTDNRMQQTEAKCYNALGNAFFRQALKSKSKDDYREALLSYLWTVMFYSDFPAEYAEALDYASRCFKELGQDSRAADLKSELNDKFKDYRPAQ